MDIKGFNIKSIIEYIKKYKLYFCGASIAVVLLVGAFFAGGSINTAPQTTSSNVPLSISSSSDEAKTSEFTTISVNKNSNDQEEKQNSSSISSSSSSSNLSNQATTPQNNSEFSSESDASSISSQSSHTDNTASNSQTSSNLSPYSKEYYYPSSSEISSNTSSSKVQSSASDSSNSNKDKYNTDAIPSGKPKPVEPQDQEVENNELTCTVSISCATILDNLDKFNPEKIELVPEDGWILKPTKVTFNEGESVYDLLVNVCKENKIHMTARWTPIYNSHYIESINNIKEFDCPTDRFHNTSGWMYCVNDWYPNYGVSRYQLKKGDIVEFNYTCVGLGADLGAEYATGG